LLDAVRLLIDDDMLERLTRLFITRGVPDYIRSDSGSEFAATARLIEVFGERSWKPLLRNISSRDVYFCLTIESQWNRQCAVDFRNCYGLAIYRDVIRCAVVDVGRVDAAIGEQSVTDIGIERADEHIYGCRALAVE